MPLNVFFTEKESVGVRRTFKYMKRIDSKLPSTFCSPITPPALWVVMAGVGVEMVNLGYEAFLGTDVAREGNRTRKTDSRQSTMVQNNLMSQHLLILSHELRSE